MSNVPPESPAPRPPSAWALAVAQPVLDTLLRTPAHRLLSRRLMLLEYAGPRSGRRYRFPVRYYEWDGGAVLTSTQHRWVRSVRRLALVRVRLRGRWLDAAPTVIDAPDENATMIEEFVRRYGPGAAGGLRVGLPSDRQPTRAEALQAAGSTTLVLFRFTDAGF